LQDANLVITKHQHLAVFSSNENSKSALLKLIAGIEQPTRGKIIRSGVFTSVMGNAEYFHRELSGEENIHFISKIYGQNGKKIIKEVKDFAELGKELKTKTKDYPPSIKRKIGISVSLLMHSDLYQLKGKLVHPDKSFNSKIQNKIKDLTKHATIIVIDNMEFARKYAEGSVVIDPQGFFKFFDDFKTGLEEHNKLKRDH